METDQTVYEYFSMDVYNDLHQWAQNVFEEYGCFTIIWI